jgi:hypothetical protein
MWEMFRARDRLDLFRAFRIDFRWRRAGARRLMAPPPGGRFAAAGPITQP